MNLKELQSPAAIKNDELRARAVNRSSGKYTRHFIVYDGGEEAAFVSLDFYPDSESLSIYEMFVASTMRGRGVGEKLLQEIETMAKTKGYSRVQLGARPLGNYPEAKLMEWYKKRGYEKPADHLA